MYGLLGWDDKLACIRTRVLDAACKEWHEIEKHSFKGLGYKCYLYACDGGVVCLVLEAFEGCHCVFVGNPLTQDCRMLPDIVLVQLVMNELF